ncbi:MAG TPA: ABC transporter permease [Thermoanaerobaculia bacterium]|nr:ABC transporter permease [Thermoanaerobaculia bacterium]
MSTVSEAGAAAGATFHGSLPAPVGSPRLRLAQTLAVVRLELSRMLGRRGLAWVIFLVLPPLALAGGFAFMIRFIEAMPLSHAALVYAGIYHGFLLALVLFFGCVAIFTSLVRREMRDRTLHYYFLTPVRRELLLVGKYLAGVIASFVLLGFATVGTWLLVYAPFLSLDPEGLSRFVRGGAGLGHLGAYVGVTLLGCIGYGAVFLATGIFFKNPVVPALSIYGWEAINFLLPASLKQVSIIYYLGGLLPVAVDEGPFALIVAPPSPWLAVPGLLALSAVLLALSALRARRMELAYGED